MRSVSGGSYRPTKTGFSNGERSADAAGCASGSIMDWHSDITSASDTLPWTGTPVRTDHCEIENFVDQLQQMPSRQENLGDARRLGGRRPGEADLISCAKPRNRIDAGLRSSWSWLERKSDLARLAFSAMDLALSSSTFDCWTAPAQNCFRSVDVARGRKHTLQPSIPVVEVVAL